MVQKGKVPCRAQSSWKNNLSRTYSVNNWFLCWPGYPWRHQYGTEHLKALQRRGIVGALSFASRISWICVQGLRREDPGDSPLQSEPRQSPFESHENMHSLPRTKREMFCINNSCTCRYPNISKVRCFSVYLRLEKLIKEETEAHSFGQIRKQLCQQFASRLPSGFEDKGFIISLCGTPRVSSIVLTSRKCLDVPRLSQKAVSFTIASHHNSQITMFGIQK